METVQHGTHWVPYGEGQSLTHSPLVFSSWYLRYQIPQALERRKKGFVNSFFKKIKIYLPSFKGEIRVTYKYN